MNVRAVVAALVLVGTTAGCTETIAGTPGPRPSVSANGDFPSDPGSATDEPTDQPTDQPTGDSSDEPSGGSTSGSTTSDLLCSRLQIAAEQGDSVSAADIKDYVSAVILAWGLVTNQDDPYAKADAAATSGCPDARTTVLKQMDLPDLKSTQQ